MLWLLAQHVLVVAILTTIVLAVCRLARPSAATQHVLWLIVLIKLMTPPLVTWPWAMEELAGAIWPARSEAVALSAMRRGLPATGQQSHAHSRHDVDALPDLMAFDAAMPDDFHSGTAPERIAPRTDRPVAGNHAEGDARGDTGKAFWRSAWFTMAVCGVWLTGSVAAGVVCLVRTLQIQQFVSRGETAPRWLQHEAEAVARELRVRRPPIVVTDRVATPFVWCLWALSLVWPQGLAVRDRAAQIRGLLVHELAHIRRRDHWGAWLDMAARITWWWNPLGWLVRRKLRESSELACDVWVVRLLPDQRRAYAESLVEVNEQASAHALPIPAIGARAGSVRAFQRRLTMIMNARRPTRWSAWMWPTFGVLLLLALPGFSWEKKERTAAQPATDQRADVAKAANTGTAPTKPSDETNLDNAGAAGDEARRTTQIGKEVIDEVLSRVEGHYFQDVDRQELLDAAIDGMLKKLGGGSAYLRQDELEDVYNSIEQDIVGVGIELTFESGQLIVVRTLPESPAAKAGIQRGDIIEQIDRVAVSDLVEKKRLTVVAGLIRGKPGEIVTLGVRRKDSGQRESIRIVRSPIKIDTVRGHRRTPDRQGQFMLDEENKIGYIHIIAFTKTTGQDVSTVVGSLRSRGMQGLVLDLRDCPGGLLSSAVETADLFVEEGTIVTSTSRSGSDEVFQYKAHKRDTQLGFPMVVLVNSRTASAAEILAACLQDHGRATIAGERTFGRGVVCGIFPLKSGGGAVRLATASFLRPNGKCIHRFAGAGESDDWGVRPDKGLEIVVTDLLNYQEMLGISRAGEQTKNNEPKDPQLEKSLEHLLEQSTAKDDE